MTRIQEAIVRLKAASIPEPRLDGPPSEGQIAAAGTTLGCKLPPSFVSFLLECGHLGLAFWETYWISPTEREDIVVANLDERTNDQSPLPPFLVSFFNNGCGDQVCFDTRESNRMGEYPIVFWDHELSQEENLSELEVVADDFAEWLLEEIENKS